MAAETIATWPPPCVLLHQLCYFEVEPNRVGLQGAVERVIDIRRKVFEEIKNIVVSKERVRKQLFSVMSHEADDRQL